MKKIIKVWILLVIHKGGLCRPLHNKRDNTVHFKGWCPLLQNAYDILEPNQSICGGLELILEKV